MKHLILLAFFACTLRLSAQTDSVIRISLLPCDSLSILPPEWRVQKDWVGYNKSREIKILIQTDTCTNGLWTNKKLGECRFATHDTFYRYENTPSGMRLTRHPAWKDAEENIRKAILNRKPGGIVITGGEESIIDTFSMTNQELVFGIIGGAVINTDLLNDVLEASGLKKITTQIGILTKEISIDSLNTTYIIRTKLPSGLHVGVRWFLSNHGGPFQRGKLWVSITENPTQYDLFLDFSVDAAGVTGTGGFPRDRKIYDVEHEALIDFFRALCSKQ